jgi:hypothetical protein
MRRIRNDGIIKTAWRHGKNESTPSLTKVCPRRTSRLNFFARITSALISSHFCADGVAILGTMWKLPARSKRRSSAGACVDGKWMQLNPQSRGSPCNIEMQGRDTRSKQMGGFKQPDFIERQEAAAKAKKVAREKFRAKAADPSLADRLTARTARPRTRLWLPRSRELSLRPHLADEADVFPHFGSPTWVASLGAQLISKKLKNTRAASRAGVDTSSRLTLLGTT